MNYTFNYSELPEIISNNENATVFYLREWYDYNKNRDEQMLYLYDSAYCLVVRIKKVQFLKGGILDSEPLCIDGTFDFSKQQAFLDECCKTIKIHRFADWIQTEISANFLSRPTKAVVFGSGNLMLTLENCSDEELLKKMHQKNRNMIRRGEREGISIHRGSELVNDYKSIEDQVWSRQGKSVRNINHYTEILNAMPTSSSMAIAYNPNGEPEAGVLFLYSKAMAYYHHGASRNNHVIGAHNYLLFEQLLYMKNSGVKKACFVGYRRESEHGLNKKSDSIQKFKEKFADEALETYGFKVVFNNFNYKLYRLANMLINKEQFKDLYDLRSLKYPEYNK